MTSLPSADQPQDSESSTVGRGVSLFTSFPYISLPPAVTMVSYLTASEAFAREKLSPQAPDNATTTWSNKYRGVRP